MDLKFFNKKEMNIVEIKKNIKYLIVSALYEITLNKVCCLAIAKFKKLKNEYIAYYNKEIYPQLIKKEDIEVFSL